jgi:ABC-2 type transport system permease protein
MNAMIFEWRLLARSRLSMAALLLLFLLSLLAVVSGIGEIARQKETIARLAPLHEAEVAALAKKYGNADGGSGGDAGYAAYYTFHNTWDTPSPAAFLALGMRDVAPYVLRVRALGLQAQLYEGETFNPELALPGKFDFAFVAIYLAPLFVIALLHDLVSSERQSGRLRLLLAMPGAGNLWMRRLGLRSLLLLLCLALPAIGGAIRSGMPPVALAAVLLGLGAYLGFWVGLATVIGARGRNSASNAIALLGCWVLLNLVLPTLANLVLARAVPVHQGVDLMLTQRQEIHGAWDKPRAPTMQKFFETHPQWKDTAPLPEKFHWKWYFAFQQLGDETVAPKAHAYRAGLQTRQDWTRRLGWLLPNVGLQTGLHRIAATDITAQLDYQSRIVAFHDALRHFYYPYLFDERRFGSKDFDQMPKFAEKTGRWESDVAGSFMAIAWALVFLAAGMAILRRLRS